MRASAAVPGPAPAASFARPEPQTARLLGRSDAACRDPEAAADSGIGTGVQARCQSVFAPTLRGRCDAAQVLRGVLLSMLILVAVGCSQWVRDSTLERDTYLLESGPLRVLTVDGREFVVENVSVVRDTVRGTIIDDSRNHLVLPMSAVKAMQRRLPATNRANPCYGPLSVGLAAVGALAAALLWR